MHMEHRHARTQIACIQHRMCVCGLACTVLAGFSLYYMCVWVGMHGGGEILSILYVCVWVGMHGAGGILSILYVCIGV